MLVLKPLEKLYLARQITREQMLHNGMGDSPHHATPTELINVLNRDDCTSSSNIKYTSHATLEVGPERRRDHTDLTNVVTFPLSSCEKHLVNGVEQVSLQFPTTYNSVKCIMSANTTTTTTTPTTTTNTTSNIGGSGNTIISRESSKGGELIRKCCSDTNKPTMVYTGVPVTHHMSVLSIPPNSLIATSLRTELISRSAQQVIDRADLGALSNLHAADFTYLEEKKNTWLQNTFLRS
uniref:Uncharacterized protein n=1 Tax=Timema cristinae TaxID=61476 RepID=A0A7R9CG35_TIMCR|nr:unnamed protein product [Timema cristinae]